MQYSTIKRVYTFPEDDLLYDLVQDGLSQLNYSIPNLRVYVGFVPEFAKNTKQSFISLTHDIIGLKETRYKIGILCYRGINDAPTETTISPNSFDAVSDCLVLQHTFREILKKCVSSAEFSTVSANESKSFCCCEITFNLENISSNDF